MKRRVLIAAPVVIAGTLLLGGCGIADAVSPPVASALYATPGDASGASGTLVLPTWVPGDATTIRLVTLSSKNAAIMTYTVTTVAAVGTACTAEQAARLPVMGQTWWPQTLPTDGITCIDTWHVFNQGNQVYAWSP